MSLDYLLLSVFQYLFNYLFRYSDIRFSLSLSNYCLFFSHVHIASNFGNHFLAEIQKLLLPHLLVILTYIQLSLLPTSCQRLRSSAWPVRPPPEAPGESTCQPSLCNSTRLGQQLSPEPLQPWQLWGAWEGEGMTLGTYALLRLDFSIFSYILHTSLEDLILTQLFAIVDWEMHFLEACVNYPKSPKIWKTKEGEARTWLVPSPSDHLQCSWIMLMMLQILIFLFIYILFWRVWILSSLWIWLFFSIQIMILITFIIIIEKNYYS